MMKATIWHNPNCGTSRNTLAMLEAAGYELEVIDYQATPPSTEVLASAIKAAGLSVHDAIRQKGTPYEDLGLDDVSLSDAALLSAIVQTPILINRPFVFTDLGVRLCRPSEVVFEIMPENALASFTKEDGEVVHPKA
jgi:arsenate reductase